MSNNKEKMTLFSKKFLYLGILQIISAVFFGLILILFVLLYSGEFILIAENMWIIYLFVFILAGSAIYSTLVVIRSRKSDEFRGIKQSKLTSKNIWFMGWSIWNLLLGILLIIMFVIVYTLVADVLSGELILLVIVLAFPFFTHGGLFIYSSLRVFIEKFKRKEKARILPGLTGAGLAFIFLIASFGLTILFYNPQWAEGVEYQQLFVSGEQEGRGYRIPAMVVLPGDIILAFSESRADPFLDWGDIDLVMKRSTDGGKTWGSIITLRDEGTHTAGNPCPVFNNITQTVWLPYCVDNKQVFIMNSTDYGITWSAPREITQELNLELNPSTNPLNLLYATGPGNGIQLSSGRIIIPSYYFDARGSHIIYSDDNGTTWEKGGNLNKGSECQVFERMDGTLLINCRTSDGYRYVAESLDGGETWQNGQLDTELPSPGVMSSIFRFTSTTTHSKNRVLFSNPPYARGHLTLKMSYDDGETWTISKEIYSGPSAYSQIEILSDYTILILFEQGRIDYREALVLARLDVSWLTNEQDQLNPK